MLVNHIENKKFNKTLLNELSKLKRKNNYTHFFLIFLDWLLILGGILFYKIHANVYAYVLAVILIGSRMRALENLVHETSHGLLFKNQVLNKWIGTFICALPLGESLFTYHKSHMKHHRWLGNTLEDPDYMRWKLLGALKFNSKLSAIKHLMKVVLLFNIPKYFLGTIKSFIYLSGTPKNELLIRVMYYLCLGVLFSYFHLWETFFLFWIIPYLTSFQIIRYLSEISEHGGLFEENKPLKMTRNNVCNFVTRFFIYPHGDAYHLVHHLFPGIPGFNLSKAHRVLMNDEEYREAEHCSGYIFASKGKSVLDGLVRVNIGK